MNRKIFFPNQVISAYQAIDSILEYAVFIRASDLHCDPNPSSIVIRGRVDGLLQKLGDLPLSIYSEFIMRLKILSGTRTDIHFMPQDGRWQAKISDSIFNIRISFMPTYYGENAVMRILPTSKGKEYSFEQLGFRNQDQLQIEKALKHSNGLILVTGPTGSGKTTTLQTCIKKILKEDISIITLEDPVEYEIEGVRQVHIRHDLGVNFASALRSTLRQDPDVIMVGEIRDSETAQVAIHTALTGHLVLSTIHTNSALDTIIRLIDMGIDRYLISSTLRLIISQRLVRRICPNCHLKMCEECNFTGFKGRIVISEVLNIDSNIREQIYSDKNLNDIYIQAKDHGFRSIRDDAFEKIDWGVTTKGEIDSVLSQN